MLIAKRFGEIFQGPFQDRTTPFLSPPPSRVSSINNSLSLALSLNNKPKPPLSLSSLSFLSFAPSRFYLFLPLFRTYEEALVGEESVETRHSYSLSLPLALFLSLSLPLSLSLSLSLSHLALSLAPSLSPSLVVSPSHPRGSAIRRGECRDASAPLSGAPPLHRTLPV